MDTSDLRDKDFRELLEMSLHGGFVSRNDLNNKQENMCDNYEEWVEAKEFKCPECNEYHKTTNEEPICVRRMIEVSPPDVREGFVLEETSNYEIGHVNGHKVIISEDKFDPFEAYDEGDVVITRASDEARKVQGFYEIPISESDNINSVLEDMD